MNKLIINSFNWDLNRRSFIFCTGLFLLMCAYDLYVFSCYCSIFLSKSQLLDCWQDRKMFCKIKSL